MLFKPEQGFRDYIEIRQANLAAIMSGRCPLLSGVERYCAFLQKDLLKGEQEVTPTAAFLFMNSYMLYQSSIETALTGHAAAIYPLMRTALESACYGYVMRTDTAIERLWLNRHDSEGATKAARKASTSAVNDAADAIGAAKSHPGTAAIIKQTYQQAINWGAHPNPRSIFKHLEEPKDIGTNIQVDLTGLHNTGSLEYERSLLACLDFGMLLGIVIIHSLTHVTPETVQKLRDLDDMKEALLESEFPETYASMGPLAR